MALQMTHDYIGIVQLLAKFQLIECSLKVYLVRHDIHQDRLNGSLREAYSIAPLIDIPYGVLLKRYKKTNLDHILLNKLLRLKSYRNHLAHQAFISALDWPIDTRALLGLKHTKIDYVELNAELDECLALITQQFNLAFK